MKRIIFHKIELAAVTTGYDINSNETLLRQWALVATGPDPSEMSTGAITQKAEGILRQAAEEAMYQAVLAAYAFPGEIAGRLAIAWEVFWQRFPTLVQSKSQEVFNTFVSLFEIGLAEDVIRKPGLVLKATAGEATAQLYAQFYDGVTNALPGDAKKVAEQYFSICKTINTAMQVDIDIEVPRPITDVLSDAANAVRQVEELPQRLADLTEQLNALPDAARKQIDSVVLQAGGIVNSVAQQLVSVGLGIEDAGGRLAELAAGKPILDFTGSLAGQLTANGQTLLNEGVVALRENVDRAVADANRISAEITNAINKGLTESVAALQGELNRASETVKDAVAALEHGRDELAKVVPGAAVLAELPGVTAAANTAVQQVADLASRAPAQAAQRATEIAQETARAAAEAAAAAAQAIEKAAAEAANWLGARTGLW